MRASSALLLACLLALPTGACGERPVPEFASDPAAGEAPVLSVYSGRKESLVGPLLARFTETTGIAVEVRYADTPALAASILAEGEAGEADVFYAQESGYLQALANAGMLAPVPDALLDAVEPVYRSPTGHWLGVSGRARVLVVDPALPADERPRSLRDLADPRWSGKLGWAPANGSFQAHVSALRHLWGEDATRAWLADVRANEPMRFDNNAAQVQAVADGVITVGMVNHYYLHKLGLAGRAENLVLPIEGDGGNVMIVSGVGVLAHSTRQAAARRLLAFLIAEDAQRLFAIDNFEYPAVTGVALHPDVPSLASRQLAPVDQTALTDLGPTLDMLRDLELE